MYLKIHITLFTNSLIMMFQFNSRWLSFQWSCIDSIFISYDTKLYIALYSLHIYYVMISIYCLLGPYSSYTILLFVDYHCITVLSAFVFWLILACLLSFIVWYSIDQEHHQCHYVIVVLYSSRLIHVIVYEACHVPYHLRT